MKLITSLVFLLLSLQGFASHIVGGEMSYDYIGPGLIPNTKQYKITLKLFRDELSGGASMPVSVYLGIFDGTQQYPLANQGYLVNKTREDTVFVNPFPACVVNAAPISYHVGIYELNVDLPDNVNGYTVTYQTCCRVMPLENVDAASAAGTGSTYTCKIPPVIDNSAVFSTVVDLICGNKPFTLDFSAKDPDSDSLTYSFCNAYDGGPAVGSGLINPDPPPYTSVPYFNGYTPGAPLGSAVKIDSTTGIISGVAPMVGRYLVGVCVKSFRNGVLLAEHRKDFIVKIGDCDFASAQLLPQPVTCNGFSVDFANGNQSPLNQDYFWDFGVPSLSDDTSNLPDPTFTYPDTGRYVYKLVVNRNQPCGDSMTQTIDIYPGLFPGFTWNGQCVNSQIQFTDTTSSDFGVINSWNWNFGDPSSTADTSVLQNPLYMFPDPGLRTVTLIVGNTNGCVDTVSFPVDVVPKPIISNLFNDTTYCGKDTIQLHASAPPGGTYSWSPVSNILNENIADPLVFPTAPTEYILSFNQAGCVATDTVRLNPAMDLTTSISAPATDICEGDTILLTALTNRSPSFTWDPVSSLSSSSGPVTNIFPVDTTVYSLYSVWGKNCFDTSTISINVKKLALADAGVDTSFCVSSGGVMLNASGGDDYVWSPAFGLSDPNVSNPIANPPVPTLYKVSVGVSGCTARKVDSVLVTPIMQAKVSLSYKDTTYCGKDTIQLRASAPAGGSYSWSPALNILNENTADPLVFPTTVTEYVLSFDYAGCITTDTARLNPVTDLITSISASTNDMCEGDTVLLAAIANHSAVTFSWSPVSSLSSPTNLITKAFPTNTTTYTLSTLWGKNCVDTATTTISVKSLPAADAGRDTSFCISSGGVMLNASGGDNYAWSPATGLSDPNVSNPIANPQVPTLYTVSVGVTGCSSRSQDSVLVTPLMATQISLLFKDTTYCGKDTIQLHASSAAGGTYSWSPSTNILNGNTKDPFVFPTSATKYIVTFDGGGCMATDTVRVNPVFDFTTSVTTSSNNICGGDTIVLTASTNHASSSFTWDPVSSLSSTSGPVTSAFPGDTTIYSLYSVWGKNCFDTSTIKINVKELAKADAGNDTSFCISSGGVVLNASGGDDYVWSPALGLSDPGVYNPFANPSTPTLYRVSVGVAGCAGRQIDSIMVTPLAPVISPLSDTVKCSFDTLQLNVTSPTAINYFWTPAYNIDDQSSNSVLVHPDVPTTYYVEVRDANNCISTDSVYVDVQNLSFKAFADTTICQGDAVTLRTAGNALQFQWYPASGLDNDLSATPVATPVATTTYHVIGSIGNCQLTDSVTVNVAPYPTANAGTDTSICFGDVAQLKATGGSKYIWSPAVGLSDRLIPNPIANPANTTIYTVSISDTLGCLKLVTDDVVISVLPAVIANAGRDTSVIKNETFQLNGSGGTSFSWSPATGLSNPSIANPVVTLSSDQQYVLQVSNAGGCVDTDTINIVVNTIPIGVNLPNAFSPNGDGLNDIFRGVFFGIRNINYFNIYNRFGELVFSSKNLSEGWDGTLNGQPQSSGVYVWIIEVTDLQDKKIFKKGIVTLIR